MNTYDIYKISDNTKVWEYQAENVVEWDNYPLSDYRHELAVKPEVVDNPSAGVAHLIDIGPFFDRFGSSKFDILGSTDPVVQGIRADCMARKWIDLTHADIPVAISTLKSKIPSLTDDIVANVMKLPVLPVENLALRKLYFPEGILNV